MREFKEQQRFNQIWIWVIIIGVNVLMLYKLFTSLFPNGTYDDSLTTNQLISPILAIVVIIIIDLFLYLIKLDTQYNSSGISYRFWPIMMKYKSIGLNEIKTYEIVEINPILQSRGWGYRVRPGKRYYNTSGVHHIKITMFEGPEIFLGTQQPHKVRDVMSYLKNKTRNDG